MTIKTVDDVFHIIQGHQITEEEIYNSFGNIPIFTGNNEKIGFVEKPIIDENDLPCISYPTKGQVGNFYIQTQLFNANNTGVLIPKEEWRTEIDLYWAISYLSPIIKGIYNSRNGIGYIGKNIMKNVQLLVPNLDHQKKIGSLYRNMLRIKEKINELINEYKEDYKKPILIDSGQKVKIKNALTFSGGNSGLTKEFIYHNQPVNKEEAVKIYSGSTSEETLLGYIANRSEVKQEEGPAILVARKGYYAGHLSLVKDQLFAINDDAYVIKPKEEWREKINLRWFVHQYQELFFNIVTSKSDNSTFSKTYMEEQTIIIPNIVVQNKIASEIERYDELRNKLESINSRLSILLEKQIV